MELNDLVFGHNKYLLRDTFLYQQYFKAIPDTIVRTVELKGGAGSDIQGRDHVNTGAVFCERINCPTTDFGRVVPPGPWMCFNCHQYNIPTLEPGYDWGPDPDLPGGGGGSSGGDSPPGGVNCTGVSNCGQLRSLIVEGKVPCGGCGTGPVVVIPPDEPPIQPPFSDTCELLLEKGKDIDTLYMKGKVDSMLNTFTGWQDYINEKGFSILADCRKINGDTVTGFYFPTDVVSGTDSSITFTPTLTEYSPYHFDLWSSSLHLHPKNSYSTPSPADIYNNLIFNTINEPRYDGIFVVSGHGDTYAMVITNKAQAVTFNSTKSQYLDGIKWKGSSGIGKVFTEVEKFFFDQYKSYDTTLRRNLSYQMAMATVLKQFNTGVTLYKKDANGKFKPVHVKVTTPNPGKPKKKVYTTECPYLINFIE